MRSPWFELVLTIVVTVALLGGLFLYTDNWPPLVVIESSSMQHGPNDVVGDINAGDLVLVRQVPVPSGVVTYVQGEVQGVSTYGEFGNVILYEPNGDPSATPVIHRALLFLQWDPTYHKFSAPSLGALLCGVQYRYYPASNDTGRGYCPSSPTSLLSGLLVLDRTGWQSVQVDIDLRTLENDSGHSGFVTMGDNNFGGGVGNYDQAGGDCQEGISCLVEPGWVEGIAQGMLPWFGALKLLFTPDAANVPSGSWDGLALVIAGLLVLFVVVPVLRDLLGPGRRRARGPAHWVEPHSSGAPEAEDAPALEGPLEGGPYGGAPSSDR